LEHWLALSCNSRPVPNIGWWYRNKVHKPGVIPQKDIDAYVHAYARNGRMDAAFDYCRKVVEDMDFNKKQFKSKLPIRLLAAGGSTQSPTWAIRSGLILHR
jgi:hypothetical protein